MNDEAPVPVPENETTVIDGEAGNTAEMAF